MGFGTGLILGIYAIACLFLIFVVLIQSGKGGGLSSLGAASHLTDALGATGAEKILNKWTTFSAVAFMVLAIALSFMGHANAKKNEQLFDKKPAQTAPAAPGGEMPLTPPPTGEAPAPVAPAK